MASLIIVGMGPGPTGSVTAEAREIVENAAELHLAQGCESSCGIENRAHQCSLTPGEDATALALHVLQRAEDGADVTLAVPGDPGDWQALLDKIDELTTAHEIVVRRVCGVSMIAPVLAILGLRGRSGCFVTTAKQLAAKPHPAFGPDVSALVMQLRPSSDVDAIRQTLSNQYRIDFRLALVTCHVKEGHGTVEWIALGELNHSLKISDLSALFLPSCDEMGGFSGLQTTVATLRGLDGCPWDRKQTHQSLQPHLLEETYETIAAIESGDRDALMEELGDLLLQVVLHTQIANEQGDFDMSTVVSSVNNKMVRRHPHVFGGTSVNGVEDVLRNWDEIKRTENISQKSGTGSILSSIPDVLPALAQAQVYQRRALRTGLDLQDVIGITENMDEAIEVIRTSGTHAEKITDIGGLLFNIVNLAHCQGVDAEGALRDASARFRCRFEAMEVQMRQQGGSISGLSEVELSEIRDSVSDGEGL